MADKKKSLKPIPPTLRGKKRYIKFEFICNNALKEESVKKAIWGTFRGVFGEKGIAEQKLWVVKWNSAKNEGILRCSHTEEENVKAGLLFLKSVDNQEIIPLILNVSGSIAKLTS
ncbi:MAG: ribonuclease P protein component 2 [archaeon]|nr:ribonuclease P protein component 2 [archaeon]